MQSRSCDHGGLRPPALRWRDGSRPRYAHCTCDLGMLSTAGLRPPALVRARSPAGIIATFAMHKSTRITSGGREPAVGRADALAMALRQLSEDCRRCVGGRRCNRVRVTTGAYAPGSCSRGVRPPADLRLLRCTYAHAPRAAGVSPPCVVASAIAGRYRDRAENYRGCADEGRCMYVINSHSCGGRR